MGTMPNQTMKRVPMPHHIILLQNDFSGAPEIVAGIGVIGYLRFAPGIPSVFPESFAMSVMKFCCTIPFFCLRILPHLRILSGTVT